MKFFCTVILLTALNCYAQDARTVVSNLQNKFKTIEDFTSTFKQTTNGSFADSNLTLTGKFNYKKKNKFKVELKNIELISNSETIWNYDKRLNRVVINSIEENQAFLNLDDIINNYPEECSAELVKNSGENKFYILEMTPKNNKLEFSSAKIWIDKSYILNKIEIKDFSGSVYFVELTNIKLNQKLANSDFEFTIPEGCKIIDFR